MELLTKTFKVDANLLHHLPFMVELETCPDQTKSYSERQDFISIGNFRHAPNWDAVLQLQKIWPLIRKKLPEAELHIYGAYPPPKATALNNSKTGFLIKGWAKDALAVMEQSRICLAPLRFGAGIKGKLLEAIIMQTPSVTTSVGSEGMRQDEPWAGIIKDDWQEFADAAVNLYNDQQAWTKAQQHGTSLLKSYYDAKQLSEKLITRIKNIEDNLSEHRSNNFTGSMLKHHSMASTKYMSQWIALKNK